MGCIFSLGPVALQTGHFFVWRSHWVMQFLQKMCPHCVDTGDCHLLRQIGQLGIDPPSCESSIEGGGGALLLLVEGPARSRAIMSSMLSSLLSVTLVALPRRPPALPLPPAVAANGEHKSMAPWTAERTACTGELAIQPAAALPRPRRLVLPVVVARRPVALLLVEGAGGGGGGGGMGLHKSMAGDSISAIAWARLPRGLPLAVVPVEPRRLVRVVLPVGLRSGVELGLVEDPRIESSCTSITSSEGLCMSNSISRSSVSRSRFEMSFRKSSAIVRRLL